MDKTYLPGTKLVVADEAIDRHFNTHLPGDEGDYAFAD